jgi:uncharacterized GH25 family protein
MKKILISLFIAFLAVPVLLAHEFWIQPQQYIVAPGTKLPFSLFVGENFQGELWANREARTERLEHYSIGNPYNLTAFMPKVDSLPLHVTISNPGTHMIYLHSHPSYIELDAEKFNAYLKEDGILNILKWREDNQQMNKPAREKYERFAKTIIQCGSVLNNVYEQQTGGKLEMILGANPYNLSSKAMIPVNLKFDGNPLPGKQVTVWLKDKKGKFLGKKNYTTDVNGTCSFKPDKKGIYLVSTVHMVPSADTTYDYHSYWGSVSFEFK